MLANPMLKLSFAACLAAVITITGGAQAQKKKPGTTKPTPGQEAANQQVNFDEAEALREAYILVTAANHDYAGHRVKAMHALQEAVKLLDKKVMKKGTGAQKAATLNEDNAAYRAKVTAKYVPTINKDQRLADLQLMAAHSLLEKVAPVLESRKQTVVLGHVKKADKELGIALKIR
jgi:hypothetical protein